MMDYAASARRHRHQAEECRAKADLMGDEATRALYYKIAETYDTIAANEEKMATPLPQDTSDVCGGERKRDNRSPS